MGVSRNYEAWHDWFAWRPVVCSDSKGQGTYKVWWVVVQRRFLSTMGGYAQYRLKEAT